MPDDLAVVRQALDLVAPAREVGEDLATEPGLELERAVNSAAWICGCASPPMVP